MKNDMQIDYWNGEAGQKWVDQSRHLDLMLRPFADKLLEAVAIQQGERILDIGCGAGALTLHASELAGGDAGAVGVDVSEPLLELARKRAIETGSSALFQHADAAAFVSDTLFDLVISRFGVMFFEDPVAALSNIRKQVRPGGRMAFMCWQALSQNNWAYVPLQVALPLLDESPAPLDPTAPGPFAFADQDRVASILTEAGWQDVSVDAFTPQIILPGADVESSANFMLNFGPLSRLIAAQDLDIDKVRTLLLERLATNAQANGQVAMESACWLVSAKTL